MTADRTQSAARSRPAVGARSTLRPTRRSVLAICVGAAAALGVGLAPPAGATPATAPTGGAATIGSHLRLPAPSGPERVGTVRLDLTDRSRQDWLAPDPSSPRRLVLQVWYPTRVRHWPLGTAGYLPAAEAAASEKYLQYPTGGLTGVPTPALRNAPIELGRHRLVLYTHGLNGLLEDNTAVAMNLASHGYVVAAFSQTYESAAVQFGDGSVAGLSPLVSKLFAQDKIEPFIDLRAKDANFVLDQFEARRGSQIPWWLRWSVDTSSVGMFGHSAGGAASLQVAQQRREVTAAVNLDGFARQPGAAAGLHKPYLFVTSDGHTERTEPTWPPFLAASGPGTITTLRNIGHLALTDVGSDHWIEQLGLDKIVPPPLFTVNFGHPAVGTMAAMSQGILAFFDRTVRRCPTQPDFATLQRRHPEIVTGTHRVGG